VLLRLRASSEAVRMLRCQILWFVDFLSYWSLLRASLSLVIQATLQFFTLVFLSAWLLFFVFSVFIWKLSCTLKFWIRLLVHILMKSWQYSDLLFILVVYAHKRYLTGMTGIHMQFQIRLVSILLSSFMKMRCRILGMVSWKWDAELEIGGNYESVRHFFLPYLSWLHWFPSEDAVVYATQQSTPWN